MDIASEGRPQTHYVALEAESQRIGWPLSFRTDLTKYDRAALAARPPDEPFGWILYRDGTWLAFPMEGAIDRAGLRSPEFPRICEEAYGAENCRWYWWDGAQLIDVGSATALSERLHQTSAGDS